MEKRKIAKIEKKLMNISDSMIPIITTTDLLSAKPMNEQILKYGRDAVNLEVAKYVTKCLIGLGIDMDSHAMQILIEDIVDKYKFDSIEDVQQCLKNGRQGNYGKTYNKLNMIVITDWMSNLLEKKAIAREKRHDERTNELYKHNWINRDEYASSVGHTEYGKTKNAGFIEDEYQKFKAEYEGKKIKKQ